MPSFSIQANYPTIDASANAFLGKLPGTHIETDIAAAASVAGLMLLRAAGVDLSAFEPGGVVLVEWVNDAGIQLGNFMVQAAYNMGLDPQGGWSDPIPSQHQPRLPVVELTRQIEGPFYEACRAAGGRPELYPYAAALAAIKLAAAGAKLKLLEPNIGKGLAMYYLVAGSKTVPHPLPAAPSP